MDEIGEVKQRIRELEESFTALARRIASISMKLSEPISGLTTLQGDIDFLTPDNVETHRSSIKSRLGVVIGDIERIRKELEESRPY